MKKKIIVLLFALIMSISLTYADEKESEVKKDTEKKDEFDFSLQLNQGEGKIIENKDKINDKWQETPGLKACKYILDENEYDFFLYKADMKDKKNYVDVHVSRNKIGSAQVLKDLVSEAEKEDDSEVLAAVNGGFFAMGRLSIPITSILKNGDLKFIYLWGSLAYFNNENDMFLARPGLEILCSVNNQWEYPYGFSARYVNRLGDNAKDVSILDDMYMGPYPDHYVEVVQVKDKRVIAVYDRIPKKIDKGTYLIASESRITKYKIKIGDKIDCFYRAYDKSNDNISLDFSGIKTALGSSPTLIKNGKISIDLDKDNLKNEGWSIYNRRPRTMVGLTKDKNLCMVVSPSMNLNVLSKLGIKLGLETAINMDGGGSSGLVVDGKYVYSQKPDRRIPNAFLLKRYKTVPIRIFINNKERFYDLNPYIYKGRTMLPLRGILEDLDCSVSWQANENKVVFEHYGKKYSVKNNSNIIYGEDKNFEMDVPLMIRNGRSAVSARYLSEILGGKVSWDGEKRLVDIQIDSATEIYHLAKELHMNNKYKEAKELYQKAIDIDSKNVSSLRALAKIAEYFKDYEVAAKNYEQILNVNNSHIPALKGLGKIAEDSQAIDKAIGFYQRVIKLDEKDLDSYKRLAVIFENKNDYKSSINYYEKAYDLDKLKATGFALVRLYKKELKNNQQNLGLLKKTGATYVKLEEEKLAIDYFKLAYEIDKKDIEIIKSLASLYELKDRKLAIEYYEKAYMIDKKDQGLLKKLAGMYRDTDKDKAINYYKEAYALDGKDLETVKQLAKIYEETNDRLNALKFYQIAYDINTKEIEIIKKLASMYEENGKKDYALRYYVAAYKFDPKDLNVIKKIATLSEDAGEKKESIYYYKLAYDLSKDESLLLDMVRLTYQIMDFDQVIAIADKIGEKDLKDCQVYYYIAKSYVEKGGEEEAYHNFKKYLDSYILNDEINEKFKKEAEKYVAEYQKHEEQENSLPIQNDFEDSIDGSLPDELEN